MVRALDLVTSNLRQPPKMPLFTRYLALAALSFSALAAQTQPDPIITRYQTIAGRLTSAVRPELDNANTAQFARSYSLDCRPASVCNSNGQPCRRA